MSENLRLITPSPENPVDSPSTADRTLPCFDTFWTLYPRHVAKLAAKKAWAKVNPRDHVAILEALVSWRQVWRDKDPEYLPHGATWLNGERWEDELPAGFRRVTSESTQSALKDFDAKPEARTAIPDYVLAVIGKIKNRK